MNGLGQIVIASRHGNFPVKKGDKIAGMRVVPLVIEEEKWKGSARSAERLLFSDSSFPEMESRNCNDWK